MLQKLYDINTKLKILIIHKKYRFLTKQKIVIENLETFGNRDGRKAPEPDGMNCQVTIMDADGSKEPFWEVDLQSDFSIKQVVYYNRIGWSYRSIGMKVELLDSSRKLIGLYEITNTNQIFCISTI